jgi:hypothetical protein
MSEEPIAAPPQPSGPYRYRGGHCCCARCRVRSLRWPVLLVTLGTLFLLDETFNLIDFGRYWPVILIVIGVVMLMESSASTEGHRG